MYESFFALNEKPFSLTPNPRFLFLSKTHNEVYAHLIYGIESRAGFVEVTGEVGTGKTTILRTLLTHLDENKYRVAFIFNPKLTAFELLRNINREFGVADDGLGSPELIRCLNEFLLAENQAGRTPVLVIDEAQNLSGEVLEQIRLLSNLETEADKLIQIVLVGQPELRHHLSDHSLRQLNQRIAVRYQLRPLNREETSSYILHRLKIAGRPDGNVFSAKALNRVFNCAQGVPRRINLICDRALLTAYSEERSVVSIRDVNQAVAELAGMGEGGRTVYSVPWYALAATAAVLAFSAGIYWLAISDRQADETIVAPLASSQVEARAGAPLAAVTTEPVPAPQPLVEPVPAPPKVLSRFETLLAGCNALLSLWQVPLINQEQGSAEFDLDQEFSLRGFEMVRLAGSFDEIRQYNVPMLIPLAEDHGGGYLAVLSQASQLSWSVAPTYRGREELSAEELSDLGAGMALLPWIDFASIGYVAIPGARGEHVRRLQFLLGLTGCDKITTSGHYDASSIECVKAFQRDNGLVVDGLVGPRTLMRLYQVAGAYNMPRLTSDK